MRVRITQLKFLLICGLIFVGAFATPLTFLALAMAAVVAFSIGINLHRAAGADVACGIVLLLCMQNFCIGAGAHLAGNSADSLKYLTQIPFLTIAVIWAVSLMRELPRLRIDRVRIAFICLVLCIGLSLVFGRGSVLTILVTFRNLTTFYMVFNIAQKVLASKGETDKFLRFLAGMGMVMFLVGLVIWKGGYPVYRALGIHEVYIAKAAPFKMGALDGRFYTSLISRTFVRMGSLFYEPVNLAYFLALTTLVSLVAKPFRSRWMNLAAVAANGLGLIMTFGKGGYMVLGLGVACIIAEAVVRHVLRSTKRKRAFYITLIGALVCAVVFVIFYANYIGGAVLPHIWGIVGTWQRVMENPLGHGLGTGGNMAQVLGGGSQNAWLESGGETAIMSFMYQIGIQGVAALCLCMLSTGVSLKNSRVSSFARIFSYMPMILLMVSMMQENTFTPQCIAPFMLVQGGMFTICSEPNVSEKVRRSEK